MLAIGRRLFLFLLLGIGACSEGPDSTSQLAAQGFLSGALSFQGDSAVIGSIHHGGSFWDLRSFERKFDWNHAAGEYSLIRASAISGDGSRAATCVEDAIAVWDTRTGESLNFWRAPARILSIRLDHLGNRALIGMDNGSASFFDLRNGTSIYRFEHDAEVRIVDLNRDASIGITAGDDKTAKVWNLETGEQLQAKTLENYIHTAALSASGELAFTTSLREDALIWQSRSGDVQSRFPNRYTNYTAAAFSDDEQILTVGTFQGQIKRWNIQNNEELGSWQASPRKAYGGASSKAIIDLVDTGSSIVALTSDGLVQTFSY